MHREWFQRIEKQKVIVLDPKSEKEMEVERREER